MPPTMDYPGYYITTVCYYITNVCYYITNVFLNDFYEGRRKQCTRNLYEHIYMSCSSDLVGFKNENKGHY